MDSRIIWKKYIHVNENICIQNFKAAADKNTNELLVATFLNL